MQLESGIHLCKTIDIENIPKGLPPLTAYRSQITIGTNRFSLSISGIENKIHITENMGVIEVLGKKNELIIENDFTGWIKTMGSSNKVKVVNSLLKETKRILEEGSNNCVICCNSYHIVDTNVEVLKCKHMMHKSCLMEYSSRFMKCPICKIDL